MENISDYFGFSFFHTLVFFFFLIFSLRVPVLGVALSPTATIIMRRESVYA